MKKKKVSQILIGYCCVLSILTSCAKEEEIVNEVLEEEMSINKDGDVVDKVIDVTIDLSKDMVDKATDISKGMYEKTQEEEFQETMNDIVDKAKDVSKEVYEKTQEEDFQESMNNVWDVTVDVTSDMIEKADGINDYFMDIMNEGYNKIKK